VAGSLGEASFANPLSRRIPLEVRRGYRDAPSEVRELVVSRYVSCKACSREGCARCTFVGWTIGDTMVKVVVPHGTAPGARLSLDSLESLESASVEDRQFLRSIEIEMVEPGPRADELRAAEADFADKLARAWQMDCDARRNRIRRRWQVVAGAAVAMLVVGGVSAWFEKASTGESCEVDSDCRYGRCLRLLTKAPMGAPRVDGMMCSSHCDTDLDCPRSMHCTSADENDPFGLGPSEPEKKQYVANAPSKRACIPNGY
jgi:hypothetical protein